MADKTKIEWADATWNPITGCSVTSPGCTNCYAMRLAGTRMKNHPSRAGLTQDTKAGPVWTGELRFNDGWLDQPLRWRRRRRVFVCAHGDLFHEGATDFWIDRVFAIMQLAPWHDFLVLTKRAERMRRYLGDPETPSRISARCCSEGRHLPDSHPGWMTGTWQSAPNGAVIPKWPLRNVWCGVSVEDQARADERIPVLLEAPAAVRWISAEPLLERLDIARYLFAQQARIWPSFASLNECHIPAPNDLRLHWVVAGGESGPGFRPVPPDAVRSLRDQCFAAGVPFLFKQWGGRSSKAGGRELDGAIHDAMPAAAW